MTRSSGQMKSFGPPAVFRAPHPPQLDRDLIVGVATEPHLKWKTYCAAIIELARRCEATLVLTLGALLAEVPHTRPVRLSGGAADPELARILGIKPTRYEGPTGIVGALNIACREHGLATASLWANVPHYISGIENPKAALALVRRVLLPLTAAAGDRLVVTWHPARPRIGDVAWLHLRGASETAVVEGSVGHRPLAFFPYAGGYAALVGLDIDVKPGVQPWRLAVLEPGLDPRPLTGKVTVVPRQFPVQRLTVPPGMADPDPETGRRAVAEGQHLQMLYRTVSPERLWRGPFTRPVAGTEPPSGFGARRIINGKPRAAHSGADYSAPRGTPVVAANAGRVALVGDYFFPGRLVALDHGLGLYTLYFHLDSVAVAEGDRVDRGQTLGTVGATGRATGPHLHFGAQLGGARIDPAALLALRLAD